MYSNLVLSGGALKGVSLLGAIQYLNELDLFKHFKQIIGTSAGAIIIFFIMIGYSPIKIKEILLTELNYLIEFDFNNITNILEDYGIDDCSRNKEILEKYLFKKIQKKSITFIEFTKKYSINFIVTGSNLITRELNYFNVNDYPEMNIIDALLITSCIPFVYKPIKFNDDLYIDGGIYNNFAFEYFDDNANDTLGIYIKSSYSNKNENFISYFNNIVFSIQDKLTNDKLINKDYNICIINFNNSCNDDINFSLENLEISIDKDILNNYYNYGYNTFKNYFDKILEKNKTDIKMNNKTSQVNSL